MINNLNITLPITLPPYLVVIIGAFVFAGFQKLADLTEEHGLKLFKAANYLFGIIWGLAGATMILINHSLLSTYFIAIIFCYIIRARIDKINHGIAAIIMLLSILLAKDIIFINWHFFIWVFPYVTILGFIHDSLDERPKIKKYLGKYLTQFFEYRVYFYILSLYGLVIKDYTFFLTVFLGIFIYEIVRYWGGEIHSQEV